MKFLNKLSALLISILLTNCAQKTIPYSYNTAQEVQPVVEKKPADPKEETEDIFAYFSVDSIKVYVKAIMDSVN